MIYYLTTPISGISFLIYSFSVLTKDAKKVFRMSLVGIIPTILYQLVVLSNPITHLIFDVVPGVGYVRGPWIMLAFIMPYYYCIVAFIFSNMRCFDISKTERLTLAAFPVAAFIAIGIQQLFRSIILSGSATACVLIIIYLTIENKQISLDALTNVPTRQVLLDMLGINLSQGKSSTLVVISIKKFKMINNRLGQQCGNLILQQIADFLKS
ncbi:MAG: diguanylate cyclase, partial [Oscillospiraceae bacterium]